jgi:hypothetical protein
MSCGSLRKDLMKCVDKILGIREDIGAQLADIYLIERTWSGRRAGDGTFVDRSALLSPIPQIVDYSHDIRVSEAGAYKSGDIILKGISMNKWSESQLLTLTDQRNIERFYKVGGHYYTAIHVKENFVTWDVHLRKVSQDETERS